jgi:hypothetical protein
MKSFTIFIFLNFFSIQLFSQDLTNDTILGSWKVVNSQIKVEMKGGPNADLKKKIEQMKKGFIGTIFNFKTNNKFTIKFPDNIPNFMKELEFLNNNKWKIKNGQRIAIGNEENGYSLVEIIVKTTQGKKYFILEPMPLLLEVIRQTE